jgi:hypothetical protein
MTFGAAPPAAADVDLVSSDPAAGAVLDAPPERMTLTYSADIPPEFAQAVVTPPGGEAVPLPADALTVAGPELVMDLADIGTGAAAGTWTVVARIVAVDGHPLEEEIRFEAGALVEASGGTTAVPTPAPSAAGTASATPPGDASAPDTSPGPADARVVEDADPGSPWLIVAVAAGGLIIAVGVAAGIVVKVRRRG